MKIPDLFKYILGGLIVVGFFGTILFLIIRDPDNNILNLLIGALIASFTTIKDYFFGSSSSSAKKDETISNALTNSTTQEK